MPFIPRRVVFEEAALNYNIGKQMWKQFSSNPKIEIEVIEDRKRIKGIKGNTITETHQEAKKTLVVGIRKTFKFQSCKPSAHYQLPLVTGCTGRCEYCYLNTQFGNNPYIRVYVNVDEILKQAEDYMAQRQPDVTIFEGAAVSDPVPVEPYTGSLARAIQFFAGHEHAQFRFVTKFTDVDTLLNIEHRQKTTIRFSINADHIIQTYEHATPGLKQRIQAANKVAQAEYPLGFIIGPVILFSGWEHQYRRMLEELKDVLKSRQIAFEVISHRFTTRAKNTINKIYPDNTLPMDEDDRKFKYGQFGYGKFLYPADEMQSINSFFTQNIRDMFPDSNINYII
ncbi:MAG: spore photoproduct lyase [Syntrophomonas sp.]|nr:spore photoproduct lyase [Syntrophomonas sp.]